MDWVKELREQLAEATVLVWKMQEALLEAHGLTPEISHYVRELNRRAGIIAGHTERWELEVYCFWCAGTGQISMMPGDTDPCSHCGGTGRKPTSGTQGPS